VSLVKSIGSSLPLLNPTCFGCQLLFFWASHPSPRHLISLLTTLFSPHLFLRDMPVLMNATQADYLLEHSDASKPTGGGHATPSPSNKNLWAAPARDESFPGLGKGDGGGRGRGGGPGMDDGKDGQARGGDQGDMSWGSRAGDVGGVRAAPGSTERRRGDAAEGGARSKSSSSSFLPPASGGCDASGSASSPAVGSGRGSGWGLESLKPPPSVIEPRDEAEELGDFLMALRADDSLSCSGRF
jgi:hypothetical protein